MLSVIIPAYNEAQTLPIIIGKIQSIKNIEIQIIVVDDHSTDETFDLMKQIAPELNITYLRLRKNLGKGGAIKEGLQYAIGDIVIFQDADLEYDPNDYEAMIQPIINQETLWTNGIRTSVLASGNKEYYYLHRIGNWTITKLTNLLYGGTSSEYEGCYKAFKRELLLELIPYIQTNNFDFDNELVCRLMKYHIFPKDIPISYCPRNYKSGKKITWKHGLQILRTIIKVYFTK